MADMTMDFGRVIEARDIKSLRERLKTLGPEDEIAIRIEAADATQADGIIEELKKEGFDYQPHGGHEGDYYLIARRKGR